ncbi:MAG: hypothetical protein AMJ94_12780 [Deltaproteobacteria bacterium SM23_61]|nr:MAG: hypothetical protein AMJ94_12780 [Deltaproteobacteria bacterium SM23_61]
MRAAKIRRAKLLFQRIPGVRRGTRAQRLCLRKDSENDPFGSMPTKIRVGSGGISAYFGSAAV